MALAVTNSAKYPFFRQILSSEGATGKAFLRYWIVLSLLECGSKQFCRCMVVKVSDRRLLPKVSSFHSDLATTSRHISLTVSRLGKNSFSHTRTAFVQLDYGVTYGKMSVISEKN